MERESLNQWFRRHAWRNQQSGVSRTSVVCDAGSGEITGFVSLSAAQIERAYLPKAAQRNQPDPLPAILLGQLAVDRRHHGRGHARFPAVVRPDDGGSGSRRRSVASPS